MLSDVASSDSDAFCFIKASIANFVLTSFLLSPLATAVAIAVGLFVITSYPSRYFELENAFDNYLMALMSAYGRISFIAEHCC